MLTEAEKKMFLALGYENLLNVKHFQDSPTSLYDLAVQNAFRRDSQGYAVDALRRAYNALCECKPYRASKEFDNLCKVYEEEFLECECCGDEIEKQWVYNMPKGEKLCGDCAK